MYATVLWFLLFLFCLRVLGQVLVAAFDVPFLALHPERRWFGGTIPIFFHCVLATFLFVVGRYNTRPSASALAG